MQVRANLAVPVVFSFFVGVGTSFLATSEFRLSWFFLSNVSSVYLRYRHISRSGRSSDCIGESSLHLSNIVQQLM
jgi:hypothetical protein